MQAYYALEASMRASPAEALALLRACVERSGGVILEAARFSNKALALKVEAFPAQVAKLLGELANAGRVHTAHGVPPGAPELGALPPDADVLVLLHVSLVHDLPDERVELPRVPG